MDQTTITRYQPGGDIYAQLEQQYGRNAALLIAQAAQTGDRDAVNEALARVRDGAKLDDSTASLFWHQITTDPFSAPLASLNKGLGTGLQSAILGVLKNPWVLLTVAGLVFYAIGGFGWLERKIKLS